MAVRFIDSVRVVDHHCVNIIFMIANELLFYSESLLLLKSIWGPLWS